MDTFCEDFTNLFGEELGFPFADGKKMEFTGFGDADQLIEIDTKMEEKLDDMFPVKLEKSAPATSPLVSQTKTRKNAQQKRKERRSSVTRGRARASTQPIARSASASGKEARWKSWAHEEEVFLVGAVMDRFFRRGSLSSTRGSEDTGTDDCWAFIKANYDKAWEKYAERTGEQKPTERSVAALSRHYKVMKARISAADLQGDCSDSFREYYNEFEMMYNINNSLLGNQDVSPRSSPLNRVDRRKRKVRLSFTSRTRFDGRPTSRRDSSRSTASCGTLDSTTSSTGSFYDEGGYVIKEENRFDEEEEYE